MGKALYRTYRSKKLSEIVGQEHITTALERALKNDTISHAYLFTGPKGVGKTSIARILAHEINGLPYEEERTHLDIIEIDAASNRRIDEIRDLRDKVHTAPTSAKYKVYIIDEVHMLTREAFNALLKTLEEPPAHVVFVLATTEMHKLPETIVSRTQRYAFKPVDRAKVVDHLKHIAKQEKISIAEDALELIAAHGEGSFRDSISLLDQMRGTDKKITLVDVQAALGIAPASLIAGLIDAVASHDAVTVTRILGDMHQQGIEPAQAARQLGMTLRGGLTGGNPPLPPQDTLRLLSTLIEVPASSDPKIRLEIALLDAAFASAPAAPSAATAPVAPKPKVMQEEVQTAPDDVQIEPHPSTFQKAQKQQHSPEAAPQATDPATNTLLDHDAWQQVLGAIKAKHNTLHGILKMATATFEPGTVVVTTHNAFYKRRLSETRNKEIVCNTIREVCGQVVNLHCELGKSPQKSGPLAENVAAHPKPASEAVDAISNIFGGAEVLES